LHRDYTLSVARNKLKEKPKGNTMATIKVTGTVDRVFYDNKGFALIESYKTKAGETRTKRYTAWFSAPQGFAQGATITVEGLHDAKVSDWTNKDGEVKHSAEVSINNAVVLESNPFPTESKEDLPF